MLYSVFLYLGRFSLRDVTVTIAIFIKRSRTAIWKWIQKFGKVVKEHLADEMPDVVVIDETTLKIGDMRS